MPFSALDQHVALVVIDLQRGIVANPMAHAADGVIAHAAALAKAFRAKSFPVVLVNVNGAAPGRTDGPPRQVPSSPEWSQLVPELGDGPTDIHITKQRWGAFLGTSLDAELKQRGVTQIVLAGISTSVGVESTARSAYDLGYNIVLATDAMTDRELDAHRNSVEKVFPRLGECATTAQLLAALGA